MSDENAERARLMAKNAATRYTAGYVSNSVKPLIHMHCALDTWTYIMHLLAGFLKSGATVWNAMLHDPVVHVVALASWTNCSSIGWILPQCQFNCVTVSSSSGRELKNI